MQVLGRVRLRARHAKFLILMYLMVQAPMGIAQTCAALSGQTLFHSCAQTADLSLRTIPAPLAETPNDILRVTGTYSSADVHGVEGLAIADGQVISRRYKSWDGLLVITDGTPHLFRSDKVALGAQRWNVKDAQDRAAFIQTALDQNWQVIQSHLLIAGGQLDVRDLPNAPKAVRRVLFSNAQGWGIYQTETALTLFDAAREMQAALSPDMVFNLDMGSYDFCQEDATPCGTLAVPASKLTNILAVTQ